MIEGIKELANLINKLANLESYLHSLNEQELDTKNTVLYGGDFLHENSEEATEDESAAFERKHPEIFNQIRKIKQDLFDTLK